MPDAWVYAMSNRTHRLYIGATTDLLGRVRDHKEKRYANAFTARYSLNRLVYYEFHATYEEALARERHLKGWTRVRKVALIQAKNPNWIDLSKEFTVLLMAR